MGSVQFFTIQQKEAISPPQPPYLLPPPPPQSTKSDTGLMNLDNKVSPSILLIIIILAIIFFLSGLLHLLVRFIFRPSHRNPEDLLDNVTALQGQLQQLFHLHDSGVDQSFIDTLPVFHYKSIIGLKDPFDCAVCLCEFEPEDKLRLLPKCSHAFHTECIDTWLLSHSTCPLCRNSLLSDQYFSPGSNNFSPIVLVLESGSSESSREIVSDQVNVINENVSSRFADLMHKSSETLDKEISNRTNQVVEVKLGKFKRGENSSNSTSSDSKNVDGRRCFSMGSVEYVMDVNSSLQVPIRTPMMRKDSSNDMKKKKKRKQSLPLSLGFRRAISEIDCESSRDFKFNGMEGMESGERKGDVNVLEQRSQRESFSVSKIWLRGKNENENEKTVGGSRRAVSFRFPTEMDSRRWEIGVSDESCKSLEFESRMPSSFARRTLLWLQGKQSKVVNLPPSTSDSNMV